MDLVNMKPLKLGVQRYRAEAGVPVLRQVTRAKSELRAGCGIVELASTCLHTLCKRDGPMPLLRDSALSPSGISISKHDTGLVCTVALARMHAYCGLSHCSPKTWSM